MGWPLAIAIVSAVASTAAKTLATQSEAQALKNKEALAYLQASEMQRRADYNLNLLQKKINTQNQDVLGSSSFGNLSATSQANMESALLENMTSELTRAKIESDYEITQKKAEAQSYGAAASAANKTQFWNVLTGGLSSAQSYYTATNK